LSHHICLGLLIFCINPVYADFYSAKIALSRGDDEAEAQIETTVTTEEVVINNEPYTNDMTVALLQEEMGVIDSSESTDLSLYSIQAGRKALMAKDYALAIQNFTPLAKHGDARAQYFLGSMYYIGNGVKQNYETSYRWYRLAAEQGDRGAQYSIANMYFLGEGVQQNNNKATYWYQRSSEQGHIAAKKNLGSLEKLIALNSANEATKQAKSQIITMENKDNSTIVTLEDGEIENEKGPAQIIQEESPQSIYDKGLQYTYGEGVERNKFKAFELLLKAAELGYVPAQYKVAIAYFYGDGVQQDYVKAAEWYQKAAIKGHVIAQRNLANMYLGGEGLEKDKIKAMAWCQIIANNGSEMDIQRRDNLKNTLSEPEISKSMELTDQISKKISKASNP